MWKMQTPDFPYMFLCQFVHQHKISAMNSLHKMCSPAEHLVCGIQFYFLFIFT